MKNFIKRQIAFFRSEGGFIQAALAAAPYVLNGLGGIFGNKKRYIDPEEMRQKYGAASIGKDAQSLSNYILNSSYGQQLLSSAATQGQELQSNLASGAAASGMDASTGASSGASDFAAAAAPQAQAGLERGVKADVLKAAMPIAAQQNQGYQALALANNEERNNTPSTFQKIAGAAGQAAAAFKKPGEQG